MVLRNEVSLTLSTFLFHQTLYGVEESFNVDWPSTEKDFYTSPSLYLSIFTGLPEANDIGSQWIKVRLPPAVVPP